jgi:tetratricopeptide (TPR) repeat protein
MNGTRKVSGLALLALCLILGNVRKAGAQAPAPAPAQDAAAAKGPQYTLAEYNSYKACESEANAAAKIKCLDDFVSKYPNSALLNFVYIQYSQAYGQQKNYMKMIETADKLAALGDKIDPVTRTQAYLAHALTYVQMLSDPVNKGKGLEKDPALAKAAQQAASDALKTLADAKKPEGVADDAWNKQKLQWQISANNIAAQAAMNAKDCASAVNSYKAELALNPDNAVSTYQLGRAYLCMNPPQQMDGFWYVARAATSKGATQAQADQVKKYLKSLIVNYQGGNICDSLTDGELNELLQLAGSTPDRPASYSLPSAADIAAVQKDMTILTVFTDLKAGGDKGKLTWLASCGLEFPEVLTKVIEVVPGDPVLLKVAFVTSDAEFEAATAPNMDVKVVGQPEAARVEKDTAVHFTGTLVSYDPDPAFFLHWDKAKVKAEDLPKEKAAPKKPVRRPAAKKPAGKSS